MRMDLSISFVYLIELFVIFLAIYLASKLLQVAIGIGRLFLMAILSYFLTPMISQFFQFIILPYVTPLIVWIVLSELLLTSADPKTRALLAVVAYAIYACFIFTGIHTMLLALLG